MNKLTAGGIAMAMAITANAAELTAKENTIVDIVAAGSSPPARRAKSPRTSQA